MPKPDKPQTPKHLGLIIDGNRRWAKEQGLPVLEGHKAGYKNIDVIGDAAWNRGVKTLSIYVFSTENWNRSKEEVKYLMDMLVSSALAKKEINKLDKKGIRIRFLGSREKLSQKVQDAIETAQKQTKNNQKGTLALCFNYGGHLEIVDAFKSMMSKGLSPDEVTVESITERLYDPDIPPVDLIIRTSGEQRLSNFMLWRAAYSELYFSDKYWPEFSVEDLDEALADYAKRQRRFGK